MFVLLAGRKVSLADVICVQYLSGAGDQLTVITDSNRIDEAVMAQVMLPNAFHVLVEEPEIQKLNEALDEYNRLVWSIV